MTFPPAQLKDKIIDFFFPPHCIGCGKEGTFLCLSCSHSLPRLLPPLCSKCGRELVEEPCPNCRRWPLIIDGISAPFRFEGLMCEAIHQFKYHHFKALALPLAQFLAQHIKTKPFKVEVLVPVSLHPHRLRERGYNQSALLARELSKLIELPVEEHQLYRYRDTPPQVMTSSAEQRHNNLIGAFACDGPGFSGRNILLIDDVCTTGATLNSAAIALKDAGANLVYGLTLAREI